MKVQEVMERAGTKETGRAIAYIKDALQEIELYSKENVTSGSRASVTANTISFGTGTEKVTNGTDWTGASGTNSPTGWSVFENPSAGVEAMSFAISTGRLVMGINGLHSLAVGESNGITQAISVTVGTKYVFSMDFTFTSMNMIAAIGNTATGDDLSVSNDYYTTWGTDALTSTKSISTTFVPTQSTVYLTIYGTGAYGAESATDSSMIDNVSIKPYAVLDSANGLGNFTTDMKLRVNGSSSNDTDESDNTSTGYYNIKKVAAGEMELDFVPTTESASNTITLVGTNQNYMDIIEDKRYYTLPSDMIKLVGVKVKNHLNGDDKYRRIPRMIHPPIEEDADGV